MLNNLPEDILCSHLCKLFSLWTLILTQFVSNTYAPIEESLDQCCLQGDRQSTDFKTIYSVLNLSLDPVSPMGTFLRKVSKKLYCLIFANILCFIHLFYMYSLTLVQLSLYLYHLTTKYSLSFFFTALCMCHAVV